jgi:hypothetical protein
MPAPQADSLEKLKRMDKVTPGDFAAVLRQRRFRPVTTPDSLVAALEAECALKEGNSSTRIGFLS